MRFTLYYDAGHGWLEVSEAQAASVGLTEGDFSAYSYRQGDKLYLEEDLDLSVFLRAWESEHGPALVHAIDHGDYSSIRHMARVRAHVDDDVINF